MSLLGIWPPLEDQPEEFDKEWLMGSMARMAAQLRDHLEATYPERTWNVQMRVVENAGRLFPATEDMDVILRVDRSGDVPTYWEQHMTPSFVCDGWGGPEGMPAWLTARMIACYGAMW